MAGHTPGWNDPPPLSFSQNNVPGGKRTLLNKRVPFPLNQSEFSPQKDVEKVHNETLDSSLSVVPSNLDESNSFKDSPLKTHSEPFNSDIPDEEILSLVISTFDKILLENSEKYEKRRLEEINQRINVMKESWDSKISVPVKHKMLNLAQELSKGNADSALKIQCTLMVDYLREVKQWMVGVKHIIEMERSSCSTPPEDIH